MAMKPPDAAAYPVAHDFDAFIILVGANIRKARWLSALCQKEAARRAGVAYRYFQDVERGRRNPTLRILFDISHALRLQIQDLIHVPGTIPRATPIYCEEANPPPKRRRRTKKAPQAT